MKTKRTKRRKTSKPPTIRAITKMLSGLGPIELAQAVGELIEILTNEVPSALMAPVLMTRLHHELHGCFKSIEQILAKRPAMEGKITPACEELHNKMQELEQSYRALTREMAKIAVMDLLGIVRTPESKPQAQDMN